MLSVTQAAIPVTLEAEWLGALRFIPPWIYASRRIVLLSPHPDDEILGAGGFLAAQAHREVPIVVVAATDGEAAYPGLRDLGEIRCGEQEAALRHVGILPDQVHRLKLPDSRLGDYESKLTSRLADLLDEDTLLLAPWDCDPHPDHEACGRAARAAAAATNALHVSYFFWAWHHCRPEAITELRLRRFELSADLRKAKTDALAEYRSQLHQKSSPPILPEILLAPARRSFETFALHDSRS